MQMTQFHNLLIQVKKFNKELFMLCVRACVCVYYKHYTITYFLYTFLTGNRNENQQEAFEQKNNLQYSNIKTEEDSNFFTYFTVITLACIAGYIGYHNKQKVIIICIYLVGIYC